MNKGFCVILERLEEPSADKLNKILWYTSVVRYRPAQSRWVEDWKRHTQNWHQDCSMLLEWHCNNLYHISTPTGAPIYQDTKTAQENATKYESVAGRQLSLSEWCNRSVTCRSFALVSWFGNLSLQDKNSLNQIIKWAGWLIGEPQLVMSALYGTQL